MAGAATAAAAQAQVQAQEEQRLPTFAMPSSLGVVKAAGAMSLELPADMCPMDMQVEGDTTPMQFTPMGPEASPVGRFGLQQLSPDPSASPAGTVGPETFGGWPTQAGCAPLPELMEFHSSFSPSPSHHLGASPAMSPGAEIRRNAASFGIPLSLGTAPGELPMPLPVRTNSGSIVAPSPVARGSTAPPPSPATSSGSLAAAAVAARGHHSAPLAQRSLAASCGAMAAEAAAVAGEYHSAPPAQGSVVRTIVTPMSAGLRGGGC